MAESKKNITVILEVKEIVFDIQNKTFLTGRTREAENAKNYEAASQMQVSDDNEYSYQIRRSISNTFASLKTELAEYLDENETTTDNLLESTIDSDGQLKVSLLMPSNYNLASADNLGAGLHQYIVNRTIADWFFITNKADADDYVKLAAQALETARRALFKRRRPVRPTFNTDSEE